MNYPPKYCKKCGTKTIVADTRPKEGFIYRVRFCPVCKKRIVTEEREK